MSQMVLHFTGFNVEPMWDQVYVYDGPDTTAAEVASLDGTAIPADIVSTGNTLTVRFTSDSSMVYPGFEASVTLQGTENYNMILEMSHCSSIRCSFITILNKI